MSTTKPDAALAQRLADLLTDLDEAGLNLALPTGARGDWVLRRKGDWVVSVGPQWGRGGWKVVLLP